MNISEKPSILVVEDENIVAMDLVSTLEKLGYPLSGVAATGEDAVKLAEAKGPGLVLMDIHLRGQMDGIRAAQQIQDKLFIPVVYLTAYSDEPTLERARLTYPFGYVLKPFEDREIDVAIQIALFRHQMERVLRDNERRLDAILSSIGDAVIATDPRGRVTFMNRAAETLLSWPSERAKGRLLTDVVKATTENGLLRLSRPALDVPVERFDSPVLDSEGTPTGYVTVLRDVSERVRAQEAHEREAVERAARAAVEKDHERVRLKSEISSTLADITQFSDQTPALNRVATLIANCLGRTCIIRVDEQAHGIRLSAQADPPGVPPSARQAAASAVGIPLRARQRVIGTLSLVSTEPTEPSEQTFVQALADRIALAIDNGWLYLDVQAAKTRAELLYEAEQRARRDAESLFRIAEALSEAQLDLDTVVQRLTNEATALVNAMFGVFLVLGDDTEPARYYASSEVSRKVFERLVLDRQPPLFAAVLNGQGVVRVDDMNDDPRQRAVPSSDLSHAARLTSCLGVPVLSRTGAVIGGLFFGHSERAQFTEQHERTARALGAQAAVAIDNARLFQATRDAEERQGRLVHELERAVRFSELFVGILGHDLRNPLSGIMTAAGLALSRAESERVSKPLGRILSSAGRMSRMIDQILEFTRVRLGRGLPLERKELDLAEITRQVLDELKGQADDADLHFELRGNPRGNWDGDRLAQLVSNLAGNAVQHRLPSTPVHVTLDGERSDMVTITVENQGTIPPEILPTIFEPLRGGEPRKLEGASGLGLGLYISQQIAVAHGGAIHVVSDPKEGTRFSVELPRSPLDEAAVVFGEGTEDVPAVKATQKKILIVEDDIDIRETLRDVLEDHGYRVECAGNGLEALDTLKRSEPPAAIVLDLIMPVMTGNELYETMQGDPDLASIPVIVSTSDPSRAPSGVLLMKKPVNLDMLLTTVARFC